MNKKAISAVVTVSLLLLVTAVAGSALYEWLSTYQGGITAKGEQKFQEDAFFIARIEAEDTYTKVIIKNNVGFDIENVLVKINACGSDVEGVTLNASDYNTIIISDCVLSQNDNKEVVAFSPIWQDSKKLMVK